MTIDALICKISAFHFGCFIYGSLSGIRPLTSVISGSDNSNQFSFILKFSNQSLLTYIRVILRCTFSLFTISVREYSERITCPKCAWEFRKKRLLYYHLLYFYPQKRCISSFLDKKTQKNVIHPIQKPLSGRRPSHTRGHNTPSFCFTCLWQVCFLLYQKPMRPYIFCIIPW